MVAFADIPSWWLISHRVCNIFISSSSEEVVLHQGIMCPRCADFPAGWFFVSCFQDPPSLTVGLVLLFCFSAGGSFLVKVMNSDFFRTGVTIFVGDSSSPGPGVHLPCLSPKPGAGIFLVLILVTRASLCGPQLYAENPVPVLDPAWLKSIIPDRTWPQAPDSVSGPLKQ